MRGLSFITLCLLLFLSSCFKDGEVTVDSLTSLKAQVFKIKNQNGKLVIEGKNLNATQKVVLKGDSLNNEMVIESQSESKIVAAASKALSVTASVLYELVLSNAYGQSTYQLSFELKDGQVTTVKLADGAVTSEKIADMGALSGQVLKYNGTAWTPADLNSLVYAGTWDASTGTEPSSSAVGGDFWIVDTDGDVDLGDGNGLRQWRVGDWIVYNSFTSQWDQVISSQSVVSFNGRAGEVVPETNDYTWQQIDKTTAPIDDLTDVDTTTVAPAAGEILKWDGTNWIPGADVDSGGDITSVNAGTGLLGGATSGDATLDVDVGTAAGQIPQLDASGLLLNSIIPNLDTSKITSGTMDTARLPYASSTTDGIITAAEHDKLNSTDTTLSGGVAGEYLDGDGNWYVLNNTAVGLGNVTNDQQIPLANLSTNTALGTDDTLVPSQNAVKTYVDNSVSTASNDYLLRDGTQAMTGNFDGGANSLVNITNATLSSELRLSDLDDSHYVALKSPDTVAANYVWKLPAADGTTGQILSTDGAGNLAWASSGDGSVTDVTATAPLSSTGGTTPDLSISQASSTVNGFLTSTDWNTFNNKEPAVTAGTTAEYRRGDKTWQTLDTLAVPENGNLYYTTTRARADTVEDQIVDGVLDRAPSQNAVFDALALKADQSSLSNYVLKAGDTMTGVLNLPADGLNVGSGQLIATGGNVGVGTAVPSELLVVGDDVGNLTTSSNTFVIGDIDDPARIYLAEDGDNFGSVFWNNTDNFLAFDTKENGAYNAATLTMKSGKVGIGTSTPRAALDINGAVRAKAGAPNSADSSTNGIAFENNGDTGLFLTGWDGTSGTGSLSFYLDNSSKVIIEDGTGNMGVGTTAPRSLLDVEGALTVGKNGGTTSTIAFPAETNDPGFIRHIEVSNNSEMRFVTSDDVDSGSAGDIFTFGGETAGTFTEILRMRGDGRVGIGTTSPSYMLDVNGSIRGYGITDSSDIRLKEDIRSLEDSLEKIMLLRGVEYFWRDREISPDRQVGLIAQEIEEVFPELVETDEQGFKSVNYSHLVAPLIESVKKLKMELDRLTEDEKIQGEKIEREISSLKKENVKLKKENEEIKKAVCAIKADATFCSSSKQ